MVAKHEYAIIRAAATHLANAGNRAVTALAGGRVEQEPAFTDRMLGHIEEAMNGFVTKGVRWTAKTLTDRGRNSQEREFGADFAGVLDIDLVALEVLGTTVCPETGENRCHPYRRPHKVPVAQSRYERP
jgi:hypothetical protein